MMNDQKDRNIVEPSLKPASLAGGVIVENGTRTSSMRLHLGCGSRYIPGFFHIDATQYPHVDRVGSVDNLDFLADESVDLIYACHVLEHFGRNEVNKVLGEWYRVLKPHGVLRLAVPDYEAWARLYVSGKLPNGLDHVIGPMVGGQRDQYDFHKIIFDEPTLVARLKSIGFKEAYRWDWRKTDHAHIDDYSQSYFPHMDKENGTLITLNVEALK